MSSNRLRVIIIAALAATLAALALTLALQPPTGPDGPGTTLYDCSVFLIYSELVILAAYYACILTNPIGKYITL
jgi:hypothetical protein